MMDEKKKLRRNRIVGIIVIAAVIACTAGYYFVRQRENRDALLTSAEVSGQEKSGEASNSEIVVHVAGAVNQPGLVNLKSGARVADAIEAAGGATADADTDALNLAQQLEDGEKITVPSKNAEASGSSGGMININTATAEELQTLPGVGEVLAQNIIDYRTENGGFSSTEDIKNVDRIGDKLYEKIADKITI